LEKYLAIDTSDTLFDILTWWKVNSYKYPILFIVTRDIIIIHSSTIDSESAFNKIGHVLDTFRSLLNLATIEALIYY